jgi:hypothetical protein
LTQSHYGQMMILFPRLKVKPLILQKKLNVHFDGSSSEPLPPQPTLQIRWLLLNNDPW